MELAAKEGLAERSSPVYEEIGDAKSSFSYTANVLYGLSTTRAVHSRPTSDPGSEIATTDLTTDSMPNEQQNAQIPTYELIKPVKLENAYKVQQCAAYGIAPSIDDPGRSCDRSNHSSSSDMNDSDVLDGEEKGCGPNHGHIVETKESYQVEECPAYGLHAPSS